MKKKELFDEELNDINGGAGLKRDNINSVYGEIREVANGEAPLRHARLDKQTLNSEVNRHARLTKSRFAQRLVGLPYVGTLIAYLLTGEEE